MPASEVPDADRAKPGGARALVTGGAGGVGIATARAIQRIGMQPVLFGRTASKLKKAAAALDVGAPWVVGDVRSREDLSRAVDAHGPFYALVHAAGVAVSSPPLPPDDALWERTLAVNLTGAWMAATACLPGMITAGEGVIVNIASTAGLRGYRYTAAYVASKHGVVGLTRALALDVAHKGVRVHAICPGFLDTPMTEATVQRLMEKTGKTKDETRRMLGEMNASGQLIAPAAVGALVADLVRDPARQAEVLPLE